MTLLPAMDRFVTNDAKLREWSIALGDPVGKVVTFEEFFPVTGWRNACEKAGVAGRYVHDFRRTAVRNLERVGVPRSVAMKLTGHKTEAVYRDYDLRDFLALLARLV